MTNSQLHLSIGATCCALTDVTECRRIKNFLLVKNAKVAYNYECYVIIRFDYGSFERDLWGIS